MTYSTNLTWYGVHQQFCVSDLLLTLLREVLQFDFLEELSCKLGSVGVFVEPFHQGGHNHILTVAAW